MLCLQRRGSLVGILLLLSFLVPVLAAYAQSPQKPAAPAKPVAKRPSEAELNPAVAYMDEVMSLFQQGDFSQLDQVARTARNKKERFPGGGWKLFSFYKSIEYPISSHYPLTDSDWESHIAALQHWASSEPSSVTARIALAQTYLRYGWKARGGGFANEVTDEQWALLHRRVAQAKRALQEAAQFQEKCPHWYTTRLDVALVDDAEKDTVRSIVEKAILFEPGYYYTYESYTRYLLPKWYGDEGESEQFAHNVADSVGGKLGDAIYFNLAVQLNCPCVGAEEGHMATMSWKRIQRGYAALEELYGTHLMKLNQFAFLAVKQGDGLVARQLFNRIGNNVYLSVWDSQKEFNNSKAWALRFKPSPPKMPSSIAPKAPVAEPNEVEVIRAAAKANMDTEAGEFYFKLFTRYFGQNVMPTFQVCLRLPNNDVGGSFDMFVQVAEDGAIQNVRMFPQTNMAECVTQAVKLGKYPLPPAPSYWLLFPVTMPSQPISQSPPQPTPVE